MIVPSLEEIQSMELDQYQRIPLKMELFADNLTPIKALKKLKYVSVHSFLLESAERKEYWGRYTFLGFQPTLEVSCLEGVVEIKKESGSTQTKEDPSKVIREILKNNLAPKLENFPPFSGGLVGYFSYDYMKYSEPSLVLDAKDEEGFKDVDLMLFDKVIAFDHYKQKINIIVNIELKDLETNYQKGIKEIEDIASILLQGKSYQAEKLTLTSEFTPLFNQKEFCEMVQKAKQSIYEGDIFQVVLSNRLQASIKGSLLDTYRVLRTTNPSPYMFYFSSDDVEIAGASPETLVSLKEGILHTFPLAGTRPRGDTQEEDLLLEQSLLNDPKEVAEHNMLVDLGRNDIGKISQIGSVEVEKYMSIERFSHVMHIGSTVKGILKKEYDALDAINSILPAGTLSGAPKLRACQIINELENNKRGIYGGAIGYIDFNGNLDTCIAIRLAFLKNNKVFIRSGAGIVADSDPVSEYHECIHKAKAVMEALKESEGGIDYDFTN